MRLGLRIALEQHTRGGGGFSLASLFKNGEAGIDFTDWPSNLFQDSAGTTPVTSPGDPVGLILDASGNAKNAIQATSAKRPTYGIQPAGGRRNLLTQTENFAAGDWKSGNMSLSGMTVTYLGGFTTSTAYFHQDVLIDGGTASKAFTVSAKLSGTGTVRLKCTQGAVLDKFSSDIVLTATPTKYTFTVTNGAGAGNGKQFFGVAPPLVDGPFSCTITDIQGELGTTPTAYQRVGNKYDVTEAGVASLHYLDFDGVDDGMATAAINFTGTDKMSVFAGVEKANNVDSLIAELSPNANASDGSFYILNTNGYVVVAKGTQPASPGGITQSGVDTAVLTMTDDISGDKVTLRRNGIGSANGISDQGTGNFGNWPLYIGNRGGSSLYLTGKLFGLIVRGAASTPEEIAATEKYLAAKSGVTLP